MVYFSLNILREHQVGWSSFRLTTGHFSVIENNAHLEGAYLEGAHFEGKAVPAEVVEHVRVGLGLEYFPEVALPADLSGVFLDSATELAGATLGDNKLGFVSLADVSWGNVNLAVQDLLSVKMLGDEREARKSTDIDGKCKDKQVRLNQYRSAVRANRQIVLRWVGWWYGGCRLFSKLTIPTTICKISSMKYISQRGLTNLSNRTNQKLFYGKV